MKHRITLLIAFGLSIAAVTSMAGNAEATPDFFEMAPGQEYPLSIPEEKMKHFLPYAYLSNALPDSTVVPMGKSYWVSVNKKTNKISHLTIEAPIEDQSQCEVVLQEFMAALFKEGFEAAEPSPVFFDRVAIRGSQVARLSCSLGAFPAGNPSRRLPPNVRLTITTPEEHEQFEEAMRQVRY